MACSISLMASLSPPTPSSSRCVHRRQDCLQCTPSYRHQPHAMANTAPDQLPSCTITTPPTHAPRLNASPSLSRQRRLRRPRVEPTRHSRRRGLSFARCCRARALTRLAMRCMRCVRDACSAFEMGGGALECVQWTRRYRLAAFGCVGGMRRVESSERHAVVGSTP